MAPQSWGDTGHGMTTNLTQRLIKYQARRLTASHWALASDAAIEAVLATAPTNAGVAIHRLSCLSNFLAWHRGWNRTSSPDLVGLLAPAHIDQYVTSSPTHRNARPVLRHLSRTVGAAPVRVTIASVKRCRSAEAFWPRVAGTGPFTALAAAYRLLGNSWQRTIFANVVDSLLSGDDDLGQLELACARSGAPDTVSRVQVAARELRGAPDAALRGVIAVTTAANESVKAKAAKPLSRTAQVRNAKAASAAHQAAVDEAQSPSEPVVADVPELAPALATAVAAFRPYGFTDVQWQQVERATRALAVAYQPPSVGWARTQMGAFARFCRWVATRPERVTLGEELRLSEVLGTGLVDEYLRGPLAGSPDASRATVRSILRRGVERLSARPRVTVAYKPVQPPYSPFECAAFVRLARHQPTSATRRGLSAVVALGLGAGLAGSEQRAISPRSIREVDLGEGVRGLVVDVPGARARTVIVRAAYEELLREAVALHRTERRASSRPLYGEVPTRHNATGGVRKGAKTALGAGVNLDVARLRSTWLVACMSAAVPLGALLRASGLRSARTLVDLVDYCPLPDEDAVARVLRAVEASKVSTSGSSR
jgi:hypothetical protein